MKIRALTFVLVLASCLVATVAKAELRSTPATLSVTTANTQAEVGSWYCAGMTGGGTLNIPLIVRWVDFNTLQFSSSSSYNPSSHTFTPVWVTLGTFNKVTERVVGTTMTASIIVASTVSGVSSFTINIQYNRDSPPQGAMRPFSPTAKFGCNKV